MANLKKTYKKPTKGDKISGLFLWAAVFLLSIYFVYEYSWIITGVLLGVFSATCFILVYKELMVMLRSTTDTKKLVESDINDMLDLPEILYFKNNEAAFEYSNQFLTLEGDWSVGLVLDSPRKNDSGLNEYHVKILNHESKVVTVTALQLERIKNPLIVGDFIAVIVIPYNDVPTNMNIKKVADTVLFIHSKLKPEYSMKESAWVVDAS